MPPLGSFPAIFPFPKTGVISFRSDSFRVDAEVTGHCAMEWDRILAGAAGKPRYSKCEMEISGWGSAQVSVAGWIFKGMRVYHSISGSAACVEVGRER
jgi:hypothetical protein